MVRLLGTMYFQTIRNSWHSNLDRTALFAVHLHQCRAPAAPLAPLQNERHPAAAEANRAETTVWPGPKKRRSCRRLDGRRAVRRQRCQSQKRFTSSAQKVMSSLEVFFTCFGRTHFEVSWAFSVLRSELTRERHMLAHVHPASEASF